MLRRNYEEKGFSLKVSLANERKLPLGELMQLEQKVSELLSKLILCEAIICGILEDEEYAKANPEE